MDWLLKENYQEIIESYKKEDWQPLLALMPEIEKTTKFGEPHKSDDGVIHLVWYNAPIVLEFLEIIYKMPIVIDFDWGEWDEGRNIASDEKFDFNTIDITTKCKLITAFARNDKFRVGALSEHFESGVILKILRSIEDQLSS